MKRVAVAGAGPMGLTAAHRLLKKGYRVTVFEADDRVGGMTASFDFGGTEIERYYHFMNLPDEHTLEFARELGIEDKIRWTLTKMGFYYNGKLYKWGDPLSLLAFPGLPMITKLRYGLHALWTSRISDWKRLDTVEASRWIQKWVGKKGYDVLWRMLFDKKFYQYAKPLSAAWIGTRIRRVGRSRKNMFQEKMGWFEGGSRTFLSALSREILAMGGEIRLNAPITEIRTEKGGVSGVTCEGGFHPFDAVVSTVPLPLVPKMVPDLPDDYRRKVEAVVNIGVVCVAAKLKKPVTRNFWLNINDPSIDIPGLIEVSNLRTDLSEHIVYAPYYMPDSCPMWQASDRFFEEKTRKYFSMVNPLLTDEDTEEIRVMRYRYAQPVCPPGYYEKLPPYETGIHNLFIADTTHSYPEDRSINESIRVASELSELI